MEQLKASTKSEAKPRGKASKKSTEGDIFTNAYKAPKPKQIKIKRGKIPMMMPNLDSFDPFNEYEPQEILYQHTEYQKVY